MLVIINVHYEYRKLLNTYCRAYLYSVIRPYSKDPRTQDPGEGPEPGVAVTVTKMEHYKYSTSTVLTRTVLVLVTEYR